MFFVQLFVVITHVLALLTRQKITSNLQNFMDNLLKLTNEIFSFKTDDIDEYPTRCNLHEHG